MVVIVEVTVVEMAVSLGFAQLSWLLASVVVSLYGCCGVCGGITVVAVVGVTACVVLLALLVVCYVAFVLNPFGVTPHDCCC